MGIELILVAVAVFLLLLVLARLLRVGCRLIMTLVYLLLLLIAASILYSYLKEAGLFDALRP